jgi:hypothetical protein
MPGFGWPCWSHRTNPSRTDTDVRYLDETAAETAAGTLEALLPKAALSGTDNRAETWCVGFMLGVSPDETRKKAWHAKTVLCSGCPSSRSPICRSEPDAVAARRQAKDWPQRFALPLNEKAPRATCHPPFSNSHGTRPGCDDSRRLAERPFAGVIGALPGGAAGGIGVGGAD